MNYLILLLLSIIPVIILLIYFEFQDKGKKEPKFLKVKVFKWGILAAILAGVLELILNSFVITYIVNEWLMILFISFVMTGFIEEGLKYLVVKKIIYNDPNFNEVMDGITYAIIASLGFAMIENVFYVVSGGYTIAVSRALISVPAHAMFSGIMGYYIGKSKINEACGIKCQRLLWKGFLIAVFYHGLFNFFLYTQTWLIFLVIPQVVLMGYQLNEKIKLAQFEDKVSKIEPRKKNFFQIIKIIIGTIFILIGVMNILGNLFILLNGDKTYSIESIIIGFLVSILLLLLSFQLLKQQKLQ